MAQLPIAQEMIPDVAGTASRSVGAISNNLTTIYVAVLVLVVLTVIYKLMTHRIKVEKLVLVRGGYVYRSGRYRLVHNKESRRPSLQPMWGKNKLPPFDSQYLQKIAGIPFVGAQRCLTLVFLNEYSPVVCDTDGRLHYVDVKRWHFDTQKALYLAKRKRGNIAYFIGIYAPLMIILGAIVFWAFMMVLQVNATEKFAESLQEMVRRLGG